jgi:hypothetical protein
MQTRLHPIWPVGVGEHSRRAGLAEIATDMSGYRWASKWPFWAGFQMGDQGRNQFGRSGVRRPGEKSDVPKGVLCAIVTNRKKLRTLPVRCRNRGECRPIEPKPERRERTDTGGEVNGTQRAGNSCETRNVF